MRNVLITIGFIFSAIVAKAYDIRENYVTVEPFIWEVQVPVEKKECVMECSYDTTLNVAPYFIDATVDILEGDYVVGEKQIQVAITQAQYNSLKNTDSNLKSAFIMSLFANDYDSIIIIN